MTEPGATPPASHGLPVHSTGEVTPKSRGPQLSDPARLKQQSEHNVRPLTWRSFTIGMLGVLLISCSSGYIDAYMSGTLLAINHLPTNALFIMIFVLALFNGGLRYFNRRWFHLDHSELMLVFAMTSVTAAIPVYGRMCYLIPELAAGQKFKSTSNKFEKLIFSHYPQNNRNDGKWIHMDLVPEDPLPPVAAEFIRWNEYMAPASPFHLWRLKHPKAAIPPKPKDYLDDEGQLDRVRYYAAVKHFVAPEGMPDWQADDNIDQDAYKDAVTAYNEPMPVHAAGESGADYQAALKAYNRMHAANGPPPKMEFIRWPVYDHDGAYRAWLATASGQPPPDISGDVLSDGTHLSFKNSDGTLDRQKYRKYMLTYAQPADLPSYQPFVDRKAFDAEQRKFQQMSTPVSDFFTGVKNDKRVRNDLNAAIDPAKLDFRPWLMPILNWSIFMMAMYLMMTSVSALLRKQWVDRERLTFPLAQVPLEIVGEPNDVVQEPFFNARWPFLIGFPMCLPLLFLGLAFYLQRVQEANKFGALDGIVSALNSGSLHWIFNGYAIAAIEVLGLVGMLMFVPWILGRSSSFFRNPLTWIGIMVPVVIHSFNILHDFEIFSNIPVLPLINRYVGSNYLTEPPWSAVGDLQVNFYPSAIGLVYLLSLEVSFSIWFFFALERVVGIVMYYLGYGKSVDDFLENQTGGINSFLIDQGFGALVGMVVFGLWMARRHLVDVFKKAVGLAPEVDDTDEAMSYRTGLLAFLLSFGTMVGWMVLAGVDWYWALLFTLLVLVILIGLSRLVCEGGLFYIQCQDEPLNMIQSVFSPVTVGPQNVVMMGLVNGAAIFDMRATAMPPIFNAYKFCGETRLKLKGATFAILAAIAVSMVVSMFAMIMLGYQFGAINLEGGSSWTFQSHPVNDDYGYEANTVSKIADFHAEHKTLVDRSQFKAAAALPDKYSEARRDYQRVTWVVLGFVLVIVFMILRQFVFWWPHPIGYVTWVSPAAMQRTIASIFLGWLIKWAITKYGGFRTYFKLRPLFVGLIAGEAMIAVLWVLVKFCLGMLGGYPIHIN
ncbi:MAG: DUF6785 family protein [Planctomycetota bacterium]